MLVLGEVLVDPFWIILFVLVVVLLLVGPSLEETEAACTADAAAAAFIKNFILFIFLNKTVHKIYQISSLQLLL